MKGGNNMQEANVLGASFMDKFVYAHIWGFGIVALVVLMLLLVYVGVRTWRKYHSVSKISLGITAGIYLAIVLPFLIIHYKNAANYYTILHQMGL